MRYLPLVLVVACATEPSSQRPVPVPGGTLFLDHDAAVVGGSFTVSVAGASPGELVHLGLGTEGLGSGVCPAVLGGNCLDIAGVPAYLGAEPVVDGVATFTVDVPPSAALGDTLSLQAAVVRGIDGVDSDFSQPALVEVVPLDAGPCGTGTLVHGLDGDYVVCDEPASWLDAAATCQALGMQLAKVETAAENTFLYDTLGSGDYWIGLTDVDDENDWFWQDGEALSFLDWGQGEPNNSGGIEHCGEIRAGDRDWNDQSCASSQAFVCETDAWSAGCDGVVSHHDGSVYLVCDDPLSWPEALNQCALLGAHLAIVEDEGEDRHLQSRLTGSFYWAGGHDLFSEGTFRWLGDGDALYTNWLPNQPDDAGQGEDCLEMRTTGWNDRNCEADAGYVCEID
jgi:hypothetical protein